jgi:hypothetical protein
MCYQLYLSTSSREDLTKFNSELVRFERAETPGDERLGILENPQRWFVGSKSQCSCTFRHFVSIDTGFDEPQNWSPEDEDNVRATAELYRVIWSLIRAGERVDCLDLWSNAAREEIKTMVVNLSAVPEKKFLLLENYHFVFARE